MKSKPTLILAALLISLSAVAQKIVRPPVLSVDRFKRNVTSLVIKANPLTLPFAYLDAGAEIRNNKTGWVFMNHSFVGGDNSFRVTPLLSEYSITRGYFRLEGAHRWYRQYNTIFGTRSERYIGLYLTGGVTNYEYTNDWYSDDNIGPVFITPLQEASRLDMIMGVDLGRTRNILGPEGNLYWETSCKLGYNVGNQLPQILYGIRFNYKVN